MTETRPDNMVQLPLGNFTGSGRVKHQFNQMDFQSAASQLEINPVHKFKHLGLADIEFSAQDIALKNALDSIVNQSSAGLVLYIWGSAGKGGSVIARALCNDVKALRPHYIEGAQTSRIEPGDPSWFAHSSLLCINDIHLLAQPWEDTIRNHLDSIKPHTQGSSNVVITADRPPHELELSAEFIDSLKQVPIFALGFLSDEQRANLLKRWAKQERVEIGQEVIQELIFRSKPGTTDLRDNWLKVLDYAARSHKRVVKATVIEAIASKL